MRVEVHQHMRLQQLRVRRQQLAVPIHERVQHEPHLTPEDEVAQLRRREPPLLAADVAVHAQHGIARVAAGPKVPLGCDLITQQARVEAVHLALVEGRADGQLQLAGDVVVGERVAAGRVHAEQAGAWQPLDAQLARLERRGLQQRGVHLGLQCRRVTAAQESPRQEPEVETHRRL